MEWAKLDHAVIAADSFIDLYCLKKVISKVIYSVLSGMFNSAHLSIFQWACRKFTVTASTDTI